MEQIKIAICIITLYKWLQNLFLMLYTPWSLQECKFQAYEVQWLLHTEQKQPFVAINLEGSERYLVRLVTFAKIP